MVVLRALNSADWFEVHWSDRLHVTVNISEKEVVMVIHMIVNTFIKLLVSMVINIGGWPDGYCVDMDATIAVNIQHTRYNLNMAVFF